jgi:hypothetical protein
LEEQAKEIRQQKEVHLTFLCFVTVPPGMETGYKPRATCTYWTGDSLNLKATFGHCELDKKPLLLPRINPQFLSHPTCSLVTCYWVLYQR